MSSSRKGAVKKSSGTTYGAIDSEPQQSSTGSEELPLTASSGKIKHVQRQASEVKEICKETLKKIIERGDKLEDLAYRTENLAIITNQFRENASDLRKTTKRRNWKCICCIVVVVLVVLGVIAVVVLLALKII